MAPLAQAASFPYRELSLSHRLRSDHRVRHDSPDDFAAQVIDQAVLLEVHRQSIPAAVKLGVLYALFCLFRELDYTCQKPRQPKGAVWDELAKFLCGASSKKEAWNAIPKTEDDELSIETGGDRWHIYRDGDGLHAVNDRTGAQKSIKRATFFKEYLKLRQHPSE